LFRPCAIVTPQLLVFFRVWHRGRFDGQPERLFTSHSRRLRPVCAKYHDHYAIVTPQLLGFVAFGAGGALAVNQGGFSPVIPVGFVLFVIGMIDMALARRKTEAGMDEFKLEGTRELLNNTSGGVTWQIVFDQMLHMHHNNGHNGHGGGMRMSVSRRPKLVCQLTAAANPYQQQQQHVYAQGQPQQYQEQQQPVCR
jgi:hypothetical protein